MAKNMADGSSKIGSPRFAPWYKVPDQLVVNVEHPYIIKNIDRGIASLGGEAKMEKVEISSDHPFRLGISQFYLVGST